MNKITAQRLREIVHYNPETGHFTWISAAGRWGRYPAGSRCGTTCKATGYVRIQVDGRIHRAHQLAWLYVNGEWPIGLTDHINGIRGDNRIANLRCVSHSANAQNRHVPRRTNEHGFMGVTFSRTRKGRGEKWLAQIEVNGKGIGLGTFNTPEEAHRAYIAAKRRLHEGNTL